MLVQRIIQSYEALDPLPVEPGLMVPVSKVKKPELRIVTDNDRPAKPGAQTTVRTSISRPTGQSSALQPPTALFTPDSNHTFGRPNLSPDRHRHTPPPVPPTFRPNSPNSPDSPLMTPTDPTLLHIRHQERYSRDESALAAAIRDPIPEFSPRQLQKFELAKASSLLRARAQEARERLVAIRTRMANENLGGEELRELQRERWMEERWVVAAEDEEKRVANVASGLSASQKQSVPSPSEAIPPPTEQARREANLAKFFARSPTQTTSRTRRRVVHPLQTRVLTRRNVEPPQLRMWPIGADLKRSARSPRPRSLDSSTLPPSFTAAALGHGSIPRRSRTNHAPLPLQSVQEDETLQPDWVHSAPPTNSFFRRPQTASSESSDGISLQDLDAFPSVVDSNPWEGSATIYYVTRPRTREEILEGLLPFPMPDYVHKLMDAFDDIDEDVSLATFSPSIANKLTFSRPRSSVDRDSLDSPVLLSRPSVDSYQYSSPPTRLSMTITPRAFRRSLRPHSSRLTQPPPVIRSARLDASREVGPMDGPRGGTMPRTVKQRRSFLRHRREKSDESKAPSADTSAATIESRTSVMSRMRKRVSILGRR
ncbi:hypothetical protein OF83DRAFT_1193314 [Amylostereum chailletii]|nr:hypothetical protein OF83DRAFT_1193314 [Amylostereum chailletii]